MAGRHAAGRRLLHELDSRLDLTYLAQRLRFEDDDFARLLGPDPAPRTRLSVIVPTYGIPLRYVQDLVRCLDLQDHQEWELCICSDGDPLVEVTGWLAALALQLPGRVRHVVHQTNQGIAAATRSALGLATGEVAVFVDADDLLHRRALSALAAKFAEHDEIDVVYSDNDCLTDWGHRCWVTRKPAWSPELLWTYNYINHVVAARLSCLRTCDRLFPEDSCGAQDWDLCFTLSHAARRIGHLPLTLYHWRLRPGSMAVTPLAKPWAMAASMRLRQRHIARIDSRLVLRQDPRDGESHVGFRDAADAPPIRVVRLDPAAGAGPGELAAILDQQDLAGAPGDALVLFLYEGMAPPIGDLSRLAAFAVQPNIGCVWPFQRPNLRRAYTLSEPAADAAGPQGAGAARGAAGAAAAEGAAGAAAAEGAARSAGTGELVALQAPRSEFSWATGNVLTGPLHGLMIRASVLRQVAPLLTERPLPASGAGPDRLGALLGLCCLQQNLRNVSVRGVLCDAPMEPVGCGAWTPPLDPYL